MIVNFKKLQDEQKEWANKNFSNGLGPAVAIDPVAGILEELGELSEAVINIDPEKIADSMGDIGIYSLDVANRMGWELQFLAIDFDGGCTRDDSSKLRALAECVKFAGRVAHAVLKMKQGIRLGENHDLKGYAALCQLMSALREFGECFGRDRYRFDLVLVETWERVKGRDWNRHREDSGNVDQSA